MLLQQVELTSHDGPIVSRTMPQDYEYRTTTGDHHHSDGNSNNNNSSMHHQPRRSYDGNLSSAIPVKRLSSFGGKDSDSMVGNNSKTPAVWDAPPATGEWDVPPAPPSSSSGIEKGALNENFFIRETNHLCESTVPCICLVGMLVISFSPWLSCYRTQKTNLLDIFDLTRGDLLRLRCPRCEASDLDLMMMAVARSMER